MFVGFRIIFLALRVSISRTFGILILGGIMLEKEGLKCLTEEYDGDHDRNCEYGLHIKSVP